MTIYNTSDEGIEKKDNEIQKTEVEYIYNKYL